mmetsp:Transcript_80182/g.227005  ORF Transcript_80182/g.227005 Transcript_80182/m.227005 type:complete len:234 (+) Transcript_80182:451-1152(+)
MDVPLQRLLRFDLQRLLLRRLFQCQRVRLLRGRLQALCRLLELSLAVEAEKPGLEGLSQHLPGVVLVLGTLVLDLLALSLAVLEDAPPVRAPLRHVLQVGQRVLGLLELAEALLGLDLPVPGLVVLVIKFQRGLGSLQCSLEQLKPQGSLRLVVQARYVVVRQPLVLVFQMFLHLPFFHRLVALRVNLEGLLVEALLEFRVALGSALLPELEELLQRVHVYGRRDDLPLSLLV